MFPLPPARSSSSLYEQALRVDGDDAPRHQLGQDALKLVSFYPEQPTGLRLGQRQTGHLAILGGNRRDESLPLLLFSALPRDDVRGIQIDHVNTTSCKRATGRGDGRWGELPKATPRVNEMGRSTASPAPRLQSRT